MKDYKKDKIAWCVTDGAAGNVSQVRGLASAMKLKYQLKTLELRAPWKYLPPGYLQSIDSTIKNINDFRGSILPDYIITAGRKSVYLSLLFKSKLKNKVKTIHIQDPKVNPQLFDHVIAPEHDSINGPNVIKSVLALNHITDELLLSETEKFRDKLSFLKKPIVTLIVGGKNNNYIFDKSTVVDLSKKIDEILDNNLISLVILFSRRTDLFIKNYIKDKYSDIHTVWTDEINNPYLALLSMSSCLICTCDSVSMISEAIYSKKNVYIFRLKSKKKSNRIEIFNEKLISLGYIKELSLNLSFDESDYKNETILIAKKILSNNQSV
jgi:mitochondrial fission protein ELM1